MVATRHKQPVAAVAANGGDDMSEVKKQVSKQCVEMAISAADRVCEFRKREIDSLVENYIEIIPVDIRQLQISQFA